MNNNLERIESVQFKTELKLKMENPFGVNKNLINFHYDYFVKLVKQNISLSKNGVNQENIEDYFRFITEHLFISLSNEINLQFGITNFGQDIMIPILINTFVLSLIGINKIEENLFYILEVNCKNITIADEKIDIFYLVKDLINIAIIYLKRNNNYLKYGLIGVKNTGKTKLIKNFVLSTNDNNNINFYSKYFPNKKILLIDLPSVFNYSSYIENYINYIDKRIFIIDNEEIIEQWIKFIKSKKWSKKFFMIFIKSIISYKYNPNDVYIINKTDMINTSSIRNLNISLLKRFIRSISNYFDINTEDLNDMDKEEIFHLISFIIKCGNIDNIFWGSLENGTNLKKITKYIEIIN